MSGGTAETSRCAKLGSTPDELARGLACLECSEEDGPNLHTTRAVIRRHIDDSITAFCAQHPVPVPVSIGMAAAVPQIKTIDALIERADHAPDRAKAAGRHRIEVYAD